MSEENKPILRIGLEGVIAGRSSISTVGKGKHFGLTYRGYRIDDLVKEACYEEVCYLLVHNKLPDSNELKRYKQKLKELRYLPNPLKKVLEQIPETAHPMDVIRTGCSMLGTLEPEGKSGEDKADRLISSLPSMLMYWYNFAFHGRKIKVRTEDDLLAGHILRLLKGQDPTEIQIKSMDSVLTIYAEHGFNASTFTARVISSTLSNFSSAITGAIGALRGPLHGGANEAAMELIEKFNSVASAEKGVLNMLKNKEKIMGFGHRVYKNGDPRAEISKKWALKLVEEAGDTSLYEIADKIEEVVMREKGIYPNVDFYIALVLNSLEMPTPMFTPMFALGRIAGWSAHILEQRIGNKLIRPLSEYTGPDPLEFPGIDSR